MGNELKYDPGLFTEHTGQDEGEELTPEEYEMLMGKPAFEYVPPPQMQSVPDDTFTQYSEPPPEGVPPQAPVAQQQPGVFMVQMSRAPRDASTMPVVQSGGMGAGAGQEAIQQIGDMGHVEGTTKTTQYTSPAISKKDGVRLQGEQNKYIQYLKDKRAEKDKAYSEIQEYMSSRNKGKLQGLEMEKAYVNDRIAMLEKELSIGVVNPFEKMPTAEKVISMIGVMAGTIGHSLSGSKGPNAAIQMFNKAMDRDISMQRERLKRSFAMLKLSTSAKKEIINQMQRREDQMRADGFKAAEYKILRATVDDPTRKAWQSGLNLSKELASKTKGKTTVTTVKKKTPIATLPVAKELMKGKGQELQKTLPPKVKDSLGKGYTALAKMDNLFNRIKEYKGKNKGSDYASYAWGNLPFVKRHTKAGVIYGISKSMVVELAAAANQGRPAREDQKALEARVPGPDMPISLVIESMEALRGDIVARIDGNIEAWGNDPGFNVEEAKKLKQKVLAMRFR